MRWWFDKTLGMAEHTWLCQDSQDTIQQMRDTHRSLREQGAVLIWDIVTLRTWQLFWRVEPFEGQAIMICNGIPRSWPRPPGVTVINWQAQAQSWSRDIVAHTEFDPDPPPAQKRLWVAMGADPLDHRPRVVDPGRARVMLALRDRGLLTDAHYSTPRIDPRDTGQQGAVLEQRIMGPHQSRQELQQARYQAQHTIPLQRDSEVVMCLDNVPHERQPATVTERPIVAMASGRPIWPWIAPEAHDQLTQWGFQLPDTPLRQGLDQALRDIQIPPPGDNRASRNWLVLTGLPARIEQDLWDQSREAGL